MTVLCKLCDATFTRKKYLAKHIKTHTGGESATCTFCKKTFTRNDYLKVHIRNHTGERPYVCSTCGLAFTRTTYLNKHIKRYHDEYPCVHHKNSYKQCVTPFVHKTAIDKHALAHEGSKPHKCLTCGKWFARKSDLSTHTRKHATKQSYRCSICFLKFKQMCHLNKHRQVSHAVHHVQAEDGESNLDESIPSGYSTLMKGIDTQCKVVLSKCDIVGTVVQAKPITEAGETQKHTEPRDDTLTVEGASFSHQNTFCKPLPKHNSPKVRRSARYALRTEASQTNMDVQTRVPNTTIISRESARRLEGTTLAPTWNSINHTWPKTRRGVRFSFRLEAFARDTSPRVIEHDSVFDTHSDDWSTTAQCDSSDILPSGDSMTLTPCVSPESPHDSLTLEEETQFTSRLDIFGSTESSTAVVHHVSPDTCLTRDVLTNSPTAMLATQKDVISSGDDSITANNSNCGFVDNSFSRTDQVDSLQISANDAVTKVKPVMCASQHDSPETVRGQNTFNETLAISLEGETPQTFESSDSLHTLTDEAFDVTCNLSSEDVDSETESPELFESSQSLGIVTQTFGRQTHYVDRYTSAAHSDGLTNENPSTSNTRARKNNSCSLPSKRRCNISNSSEKILSKCESVRQFAHPKCNSQDKYSRTRSVHEYGDDNNDLDMNYLDACRLHKDVKRMNSSVPETENSSARTGKQAINECGDDDTNLDMKYIEARGSHKRAKRMTPSITDVGETNFTETVSSPTSTQPFVPQSGPFNTTDEEEPSTGNEATFDSQTDTSTAYLNTQPFLAHSELFDSDSETCVHIKTRKGNNNSGSRISRPTTLNLEGHNMRTSSTCDSQTSHSMNNVTQEVQTQDVADTGLGQPTCVGGSDDETLSPSPFSLSF